ncbi:hypothetical protein ACFSC6_07240 [Rufibacter sediminis]
MERLNEWENKSWSVYRLISEKQVKNALSSSESHFPRFYCGFLLFGICNPEPLRSGFLIRREPRLKNCAGGLQIPFSQLSDYKSERALEL